MKPVSKLILGILTYGVTPTFAANLDVYVKNPSGTGIAGAQVAAISFGDRGPDASRTQIATADANGLARFTGTNALSDSWDYLVVATTQGYLPSIDDQYSSPDQVRLFTGVGMTLSTPTITLNSTGVTKVGEVDIDIEGASVNALIFGEIKTTGGDQFAVARGIVRVDGAGTGRLKIFNVPFASTNSYNVAGFDPVLNKFFSRPVDLELANYRTLIVYTAAEGLLNFANAMQFKNVEDTRRQGAVTGGVNIEGVVIDTTTAENPIPHVGMNFTYQANDPYCGNFCQRNVWTNTDENGRFQMFGLQANTTYYAQVNAQCDWRTNICYEGSNSTFSLYTPFYSAPVGTNDIFYAGASAFKKIRLNRFTGGTGKIAVYVKDTNGISLPQAWVHINQDWMMWETAGSCDNNFMTDRSNPGLASTGKQATTGYALLEQLPSGNYVVQVWTQFSRQGGIVFNAGPDGQFPWGGGGPSSNCSTDDLRITIDTTSANNVDIYNARGQAVALDLSSITITVPIDTGLLGRVKGTITFPRVVDLSNDPINITLQPQCGPGGPCSGGGYAVISGTAVGPTHNYSVSVATGQSYWMNVTSNYWGQVREGGGEDQISLTSTGTWTRNMKFAQAGRFAGTLYNPDGSVFQPTNTPNNNINANINLSGDNVDAWGWGQVNQDGTFSLGGLLPGRYKVRVQGWGNFQHSTPKPTPTVTIIAGQDTYQDVNLVKGVNVRVDISTAILPTLPKPACPPNRDWDCPPEVFSVYPVPSGTDFSQSIANLLVHDDEDAEFAYAASTSSYRCNGPVDKPQFCVKSLPAPSVFDFYLLRKGSFDESNADGVRPYFVVLNSSRNVVINDTLATATYVAQFSTKTVQPIGLNPAASLAGTNYTTLKGAVAAQNIIRQQDFESFGGDFRKLLAFIPLVNLYDSENTLKASGLVVPNPVCLGEGTAGGQNFDKSVADGNYSLFKTTLDSCVGGFGYEIRGLTPNQTYTGVLTTPNYPPYQFAVTLGVAGSTKTVDVNLDSAVGSGATLTGVVSSTSNVAIANASVAVEAQGYNNDKKKTLSTDNSGRYKAEGLPAGTYKVSVVAQGYALAETRVDVTGNSSFNANFSLQLAGSSISGSVYAFEPGKVSKSGVQILAYNDTLNVANPNADLSLYKVETSSSGYYLLSNLEPDKIYKIFVKAPGRFIFSQSTRTTTGAITGFDFDLTKWKKPLDIEVFGFPTPTNYEFIILNPDDFKDGSAWIGESPFVLAASTDVKNYFEDKSDKNGKKLILKYPLANLNPAKDYVLRIEAVSRRNKTATPDVTKEVVFGTRRKGNSTQAIDDAIIGDDSADSRLAGRKSNEAPMDISGSNASALVIPVGSMIPVSSAAVPACKFSQADVNASTVAALVNVVGSTAPFVSGIYQVELASVNFTDKGFDLTLSYDKSNSKLDDIAVHHFNEATQKWEVVPGLQTINPLKGTITVKKIKSLASVLGLKSGSPMKAQATRDGYVPSSYGTLNHVAGHVDSGSFAILKPSLAGTTYTGTVIKVFNFPNPFNLSSKTPTLVHVTGGQTVTTTGTVIKYELPSSVSGQVTIRIYTLNGELVRELDQGVQTGGAYYYTAWDGKNKDGQDVANGVYYGILHVPGAKLKDTTFKMAVIK